MDFSQATSSVALSGRQLFPPLWFRQLLLFLCLFLGISHAVYAEQAKALALETSSTLATAGYFQLRWFWPDAPDDVNYQLSERQIDQQTLAVSVKSIYQGSDTASIISGKPDGRYEYRVIATSNAVSEQMTSNAVIVDVAHHSLTDALLMFSLGVVIFIAILIAIFRGARQTGY